MDQVGPRQENFAQRAIDYAAIAYLSSLASIAGVAKFNEI